MKILSENIIIFTNDFPSRIEGFWGKTNKQTNKQHKQTNKNLKGYFFEFWEQKTFQFLEFKFVSKKYGSLRKMCLLFLKFWDRERV